MLWLFLCQMAFVVPLWTALFMRFIKAMADKQRARATVFAILTFAPVLLVTITLVRAYSYSPEDNSKDVFSRFLIGSQRRKYTN